MKIIYRPQRATLEESLKASMEFSSIDEMLSYLTYQNYFNFTCSDIYISFYCYDKRINENTFVISIGRYGKTNYLKKYKCPQAIGYCSFRKERKNESNTYFNEPTAHH